MKSFAKMLITPVLGAISLCSVLLLLCPPSAQAATTEALNCSASYQIVQTFANQAKWEMCWEPRAGYGYRLTQVIFTPPNGIRRKIMGAMHAAQLFVPYDDNGARYRDISYGVNLAPLAAAECPGGSLLTNSTVCLIRKPAGYRYKNINAGGSQQSDSFELFGYYGVGNYYYTFKYTFFDDGSIEPSVLASGSLQRYGGTQLTGWPVGNQLSINHSHLVIWRLDFDLDGPANNLVEQVEFSGSGTDNRNMTVTPLPTETKKTNDLSRLRFWRVRNTTQNNNDGRNISYEIEPSVSDQLRAPEDFTQNDFYLTQNRAGEELVDSGLVSFVNGETVTDAVLWYGVNFHHVPRGEDDVKMPAHSQGFRIHPRDVTLPAPVSSNTPPALTNPGAQTSLINASVNLQINASDVNPADVLTFSASGLPAGLNINSSTGRITGTISPAAVTTVTTVTVSDGRPGGTVSTNFTWNIEGSAFEQQTFSIPATVTIRDNSTALPYPIGINVSGMSGSVTKVTLTLNGLSHTYPADIDMLLVGPGGQKVMLMSDAGGGASITNVSLKFDPAAAATLPQSGVISAGSYKPANYDTGADDTFPAPSPAAPYSGDLSAFNGTSPNGAWNLYVRDDSNADAGQILNGVVLSITTNTPVDTAPPAVAMASPAAGSTVSGAALTVSATATDNVAVAGVQFKLDGVNLGAEDTVAPYAVTWNSTAVSNGPHTLTAAARDTNGNRANSSAVNFTVDNAAPVSLPDVIVTSLSYSNGIFTSTIKNQGAATNPPGRSIGVGYSVDGVYRTYGSFFGSLAPGASITIGTTGTAYHIPSGVHTITAWADDANRFAESDEANNKLTQTITVNLADTTPPSVAITGPANGVTLPRSTLAVTASASDNIGLNSVQFKLDGVNLGSRDTAAPYAVNFNTTAVTEGVHTLTAVAQDLAGNTTTSAPVMITVNNSVVTTLPDVVITSLSYSNGAFTCTVQNQGTQATPSGISIGVSYFVNGVYRTYGSYFSSLAAGASVNIGTTGPAYVIPSGSFTLSALADDNNRFAERDETNNRVSQTVTVP